MATETDIQEVIERYKRPFNSSPTYTEVGDCIELFFSDEDFHADRVDCWLTVYRSFGDGRVIGFLLKNVKTLLSAFASLGLDCRVLRQGSKVQLLSLIAFVPWVEPAAIERDPYRDLLNCLKTHPEVQEVDLKQVA
jgi:hypothetical protein